MHGVCHSSGERLSRCCGGYLAEKEQLKFVTEQVEFRNFFSGFPVVPDDHHVLAVAFDLHRSTFGQLSYGDVAAIARDDEGGTDFLVHLLDSRLRSRG
jgi:hypothetical protein